VICRSGSAGIIVHVVGGKKFHRVSGKLQFVPFRPVARIRLFVWQEPLALHARKQAEQIGYRIFQSYPMRHPKQMQALEWSQDQKMFAGE